MNIKDRIVKKLLEFGKKNRLFVYPTLALVAVVTAISHAIRWGRSSGKKLVASMVILSLLFAQSVFIRSSAEVTDDGEGTSTQTDAEYESDDMSLDEDGGIEKNDNPNEEQNIDESDEGSGDNVSDSEAEGSSDQKKLDDEEKKVRKGNSNLDQIKVNYYMLTTKGSVLAYSDNPIAADDDTVTIYVPNDSEKADWGFGDSSYINYYNFSDLYADTDFLISAESGKIETNDTDIYDVYYTPTRTAYPLLFTESSGEDPIEDITMKYNLSSVVTPGDLYPPILITVGDKSDYNAYKWGYDFEGLTYASSAYEIGKNIKVTPQSQEPITFYYNWSPCEVDVVFELASSEDTQIDITGDKTKTVRKTVGGEVTLFTEADISAFAGKEGYYLSGWTDGTNVYNPGQTISVDDLIVHKGSIENSPNVECKTLTAVWSYKDINLNAAGSNCGVAIEESGITISGVYGEEISCVISANYKFDNTDGNKFSYAIPQEDIYKLGAYGLAVTTTSDGEKISSYKISGKLTDVTKDPIAMNLQVIDDNKPEGNKVTNYTISVVSSKRLITVDNSTVVSATSNDRPSKVYDGNDNISVSATAGVDNKIEGDDVSVSFDTIAILDNPNAGKNKSITLKNLKVVGNDADKYELSGYDEDGKSVTVAEIAEVARKTVTVTALLRDGESNSILFGQESPLYTVRLADPNELTESDRNIYNAAASDDAREAFMSNYVGFGGWDTLRQIYSPKGSYTIKPIFDDTDSNYTVNSSGLSNTFIVGRDAGTKDVDYLFSTELKNNYYPGLTITPTGKYNKIRLLSAADGDIDITYSRSVAEGLFGNSITLPDMTDGTVVFQLLGTAAGKGAISEIITLKNINVDSNPPEYVSHTVSPNSSYFNQYHFGSYYHKQNIDGVDVESVTISIEYKSKDSACDKLYYFFADENGNPKGDTIRETPMTKNANGNYTGTIIVGTGLSGQIIVYASDTTGNCSVKSRIKMSDIEDFLKNDGKYYEWMVENTINSAVINVSNVDGSEASTAAVWHNGIVFNVDAEDGDSGVNKIDWTITGPDGSNEQVSEAAGSKIASVKKITSYGKVLEYNFVYAINDAGRKPGNYYASAVLYDNAGNSVSLDQVGPFLVDCKPPVIDCDEPKNEGYTSGVVFDFTVTEGEDESGVSSVRVYKGSVSDGTLVKSYGVEDSYQLNVTSDGKYIIVAEDLAGNVAKKEVEFKGISDINPEDPSIVVKQGTGIIGNDGWYIEEYPTIVIKSKNKTSDNVPVTTRYTVKTSKKEIEKITDSENYEFVLNESGSVSIEAYSESESGCKSNTVSTKLKVDVKAPDVYITESTIGDDGKLWISFRATDDVSGVDTTQVTVNGTPITVEEIASVVNGKFVAEDNTTYSIVVKDKAGNVTEEITFTPLGMSVSPITNITDTTADISADVYVGTYELADSYIAYRVAGSSSYDTCLSNKFDTNYGLRMEYSFRDLKPDTEYEYRVYAMTKGSKETKVVEGKFKTAKTDADGSVYGKVTYGDSLSETFKTYPIYVNIYKGSTIVAGATISDEVENSYEFNNLDDGTYRVVATNGLLTREASVAIENSGVVYPKDYLSTNGINFELSGLSTRVVIEDGAICLAADGLEKIYNTALYNGNVTDADMAIVAEGGSIDIALYASYIDVNDVGQTTQSILQDKIGKDGEIKKYIQLYIVKTVRDSKGNLVNGTPTNITRLAEKITVAFPLEELSGQKIYVASLHGDNSNYSFMNWDGNSDIQISSNYVTISTDRFSVYALYLLNVKPNEYTVKWIDGDGNILKTEKVMEGNSATPPTGTPKKSSSEKYYYVFVGWDTEYKYISKDTVIAARFSAHKKNTSGDEGNKKDDPTTENKGNSGTTEDDKKPENKPNNNVPNNDNTNPNKTPNTGENKPNESTPSKEPANNGTPNKSSSDGKKPEPSNGANNGATYTYMGSADSPKTADYTPVALIVVVMVGAACCLVILNRKKNEYVD